MTASFIKGVPARRRYYLLLGLLVVLAACGVQQQTPSEIAAPSESPEEPERGGAGAYAVEDLPGGAVVGKVSLAGKVPPPGQVVIDKDQEVCGTRRRVYPVRIEEGGLVGAVVWIGDIRRGKAFNFPQPVLDQKKCEYLPHIVLMPPGEVTVESSDPVPHNIHTFAQFNRSYNESMNPLRRSITLQLRRPERVDVRCDLHGWMKAYVVVAENPYYVVTAKGGRFKLEQVPAGRYRLKAWHETLGELEQEIVVEAGKTTTSDFTFESK